MANGGALPIVYRDEHLVVVEKPAGLLVHRSEIDRRETRFALQLVRDQLGQRVWPVHRLDRPTSGLLLLALDVETARRLTAAFTARAVEKRYLAVVRGHPEGSGRIDHPLAEVLDPFGDRLVGPDRPPRPAVTDYRRLATVELPEPVGRYATARYALLELTPLTGRKHQLRRHLKHIFHPIVGDTTYGDGRHNRFFRARFGCARLLLVATRLAFDHPRTGLPMDLAAQPGADFRAVTDALGWSAEVAAAGGT
ncbi:MAG: pseudouridine synthase [Gammaproteobacteria bacterium]|nr:pseudouridine synthase [Gammaproteobacteria bacterium]